MSIGGLNDGAVYDVYCSYVTEPAATGNGITMGLNPAELTTYDQSFLDHQVTRMFGAWQEYEVALGPATVTNGAVNLTISNASLSSSANWSGVRLSIPISAPVPYRFYTITPCRVVDTRLTGVPFTQSSPQQVFQVTGECGIPANAHAVAGRRNSRIGHSQALMSKVTRVTSRRRAPTPSAPPSRNKQLSRDLRSCRSQLQPLA